MAESLIRHEKPFPRRSGLAPLRPLLRALNWPAVLIAGSRLLPFWSLLRHQGRRSGRRYSTPVAARRTAEGFAVPLAFGATADWCRNVLAAGGCEIRWSGLEYRVNDPRIVDAGSADGAFTPLERRILRLIRIKQVLLVRHARRNKVRRNSRGKNV